MGSEPAIRVEHLGKKYQLIHGQPRERYRTLRESLVGMLRRPATAPPEEFWALTDVAFEVQPGEVVGIIGRNGAGKSTLLKILSRITKPTTGRVELNGRVGSLLEVGTGFHPELTGRENVFLNGSILGMSRREIARRFDEIVAFSEVEKFLDTPVKRYSSGMYVRLAFAVAAHLEPEILIVDEVLAVGDSGFQRKCFAKMEAVRRSGRTVLVVSHNLVAITNICTRAITLDGGRVVGDGAVGGQTAFYLNRMTDRVQIDLDRRTDRDGDQTVRVTGVYFAGPDGRPADRIASGDDVTVVVRCRAEPADATADLVALSCWTVDGTKLFHIDTALTGHAVRADGPHREYRCRLPDLSLAPGRYLWNVAVSGGGVMRDHIYTAATLEVAAGDYYRTGRDVETPGGVFLVRHEWASAGGAA